MRSVIVLVSLAYMATVATASKAADAELFEAMQDRSVGMMDRSAELQDRAYSKELGMDCYGGGECQKGLECKYVGSDHQRICVEKEKGKGEMCGGSDACKAGLECKVVGNPRSTPVCVEYIGIEQVCGKFSFIQCGEGLECSTEPVSGVGTCVEKVSEVAKVTECPAGWIPLANTCPSEADELLCVTIGAPLKYVSWFHLQYECDAIGGHLPEPTADNKVNLELVLSSIHSLFATDTPILMYLGATDVTHDNVWKWLKTAGALDGASEAKKWKASTKPTKADNKDCLAQQSSDKLWTNVDCEDDTLPNQIANVCFASPATAKALPAA